MKNYFKFKCGYYNVLKEMTDKQAGELIKGISAYAFEDKPFITKDGYLKGLFLCAKRDIDESRRDSFNGKKGAEVRVERMREQAKKNGIGLILGSLMLASDKTGKAVEVRKDGE